MKKNLKYITAGIMAIAASWSCQKEFFTGGDQPLPSKKGKAFTIEATVDAGISKSLLDTSGDIFWSNGDALTIFQGSNNLMFTTQESGLSCRFTYQGDLSPENGDHFWGLYPYNANASISGGVISTVIPTEQVATPGSFGPGANLAVAYAPFMAAMSFRNAAGYAKVSFKTADNDSKITKITIRSIKEDVLLSGNVDITPVLEDDAVSDVSLVVTSGEPYASVKATSGYLQPDTDYYIVVAPAALTQGYRVEFETSDGIVFSKDYTGGTYNNANFQRNKIAPVGKKNLDNYETPFEAYWRLTKSSEFVPGKYLLAYNMGSGNLRIFDDSKTDCYISSGWPFVDKFFIQGASQAGTVTQLFTYAPRLQRQFNSWASGDGAPQGVSEYVLYAFRNAWADSSNAGFEYYSSDLICNVQDKIALDIDQDMNMTVRLFYKHNGTSYYKNVLLDGCTSAFNSNAAVITGTIAESCLDGLAEIIMTGKGGNFQSVMNEEKIKSGAIHATTVPTTVGFCTTQQTTVDGTTFNNMFMIKNEHLADPTPTVTPQAIWLFHKETRGLSYSLYKEINN